MPLVFAAALGGNLSIIGAPGNLMGVNALQEMGLSTSFFMYAPVGVPMLILGILYFAFIGYRFLPDGKNAVTEEVGEQKDFSNVPKWKQEVSLIVLILVILAMIFEKEIGISIQVSACIGAIILVLTGVISEKDALKSIDLKVVLLFGGSPCSGKSTGYDRSRCPGCRQDCRPSGCKSESAYSAVGNLHCNLCTDELHVQHSNDGSDGTDCCITGKQSGGGSASSCYRNRYCRFLCICDSDRHAGEHYGSRTWRI